MVNRAFYSDDPVRDAERWIAEQERRLELLPKCASCGQPIQTEEAVCVDGAFYCEECELDAWEEVRENYLESIEVE